MKYFALKLLPCRSTFAQDMTPEEREIMKQHSAYWRGFMDKGMVLVFGPVLDPKGAYGLGIIQAEDDTQVTEFIANDPACKINTYEYHQMLAVTKL